jgi:hypothetical protein
MKKVFLLALSLSLALILADCDSNGNNGKEDNTPVLSSLSPSSSVSHMPAFTLNVTGSKFTSNSKIVFDGQEKETTYVSQTQLTCQISPEDTRLSSTQLSGNDPICNYFQDANAAVLVRNPVSEGGDSNTASFNILANPTFPAPTNISSTTAYSEFNYVAMDYLGNIYVVWIEDIDLSDSVYDYRLFFAKTGNYGLTWTNPTIIGGDLFRDPRIAVDKNGYLYITGYGYCPPFYNYEIYFIYSTDGGNAWRTESNISHTKSGSDESSVVVDSTGRIYVSWSEYIGNSYEIYAIYSDDGGHSWSNIKNISKTPGDSRYPFLYLDSKDTVCLIWTDYTGRHYSSRPRVFFSRMAHGDTNWMEPVNVFDNAGESWRNKIDLTFDANDNLYIVSNADINGQIDICLKKSIDGGKSWGEAINISNSAYESSQPNIAVDYLGNISVVWKEKRSSSDYFILFSRSCNDGVSWSQPVQILNSNRAWDPSIFADNEAVLYLFWEYRDIYFTSTKND